MPSKLLSVKVECHQCDLFRVRAGNDDVTDFDELTRAAVSQLQTVDRCPHNQTEMEVTTYEESNRQKRKRFRYV